MEVIVAAIHLNDRAEMKATISCPRLYESRGSLNGHQITNRHEAFRGKGPRRCNGVDTTHRAAIKMGMRGEHALSLTRRSIDLCR